MEKDLVELFESVKKAADAAAADSGADSSPEEDRCLDALERLKKFPVSYQLLVSSQVGKPLRQLTKHPRKRIQALASDVVEMWKTIIVKETSKKRKNVSIENKGAVKAECGDSEAKRVREVAFTKAVNTKKADPAGGDLDDNKNFQRGSSTIVENVCADAVKVDIGERSSISYAEKVVKSETSMPGVKGKRVNLVKKEKITAGEHINVKKFPKQGKTNSDLRNSGSPKLTSVPYCKDQQRDRFRDILAESLCKVSSEVDEDLKDEVDACDPYQVAVLVETAMFEKWGRSNGPHNAKYRSIKFNIGDPNNPDFRRKLLLGIFPPHSIVELTSDCMASDARKRQNEKIKEKALLECQRGGPPQASTNQFRCGRCGKKETTYYQMQTRSADEPMTTYVTCVSCNNRWKC